jgi:hypothetical protein
MRRTLLLIVALAACDARPAPPPVAPGPGPAPVAVAKFGTFGGVVVVKGDDLAPVTKKIVGQEAHCGTEPVDLGVWRVDAVTKGLRDAYVWIEAAGVRTEWPAASTPVLDNGKCVFHPPVVLMAPGDLRLANSDTIPHSAQIGAQANAPENVMLPPGASRLVSLRIPERIEVTCSVHPWMHAVVIVAKVPWGALTGEGGAFEIARVPVGRHRVKAWHRCVGEVEIGEVEVEEGRRAEVRGEVVPATGFRTRFK